MILQVTVAATGEYLISAAGEIHLEKCLEDMTKYFAPDVELHISTFVVPFRETLIEPSPVTGTTLSATANDSRNRAAKKMESILQRLDQIGTQSALVHEPGADTSIQEHTEDSPSEYKEQMEPVANSTAPAPKDKTVNPETRTGKQAARHTLSVDADLPECPVGYFQLPHSRSRTRVLIHVSSHPMPEKMLKWVEKRGSRKIPQLIRAFKTKSSNYENLLSRLNEEFTQVCEAIIRDPTDTAATDSISQLDWKQLPNQLLALGPNQTGPNMLFCRLQSNCFPVFTSWGQEISFANGKSFHVERRNDRGISLPLISYGKALLRGFQLATERGPLCAEPMRGVMFMLEEIFADDCCILDTPRLMEATDTVTTDGDTKATEAIDIVGSLETAQVDVDATKDDAIKKRRRAPRLTSISWLDDDSDGQFENDDDNLDFDPVDDWDWQSGDETGEESHKSEFSHESYEAEDDDACENVETKRLFETLGRIGEFREVQGKGFQPQPKTPTPTTLRLSEA
ncbi:unnamed protein product [Echinostoma caproni]|uniref:EFG_C domain-containing protein n=1 Tax=Echinostoma caproni TaxID=27848 RepID=A0A183B7U5_9TREM|nr:unnamed protein product [Echinostoma caproni]